MRYRSLGRTGKKVSVISLGSGGPSRLGQDRGASIDDMAVLVRTACELGINFFDTAPAYGDSEEILGHALRDVDRGTYLLATKVTVSTDGRLHEAEAADTSVTRSLRRLGTDHVDIVQLHGVRPEHYSEAVDRLLPVLEARRRSGDVRFIGVTEASRHDPDHSMLAMALKDGRFDTVMVEYNLDATGAAAAVFPSAVAAEAGVIVMRVVTAEVLRRSPAAAAYRFAAAHPAVATVLSGTADPAHLAENVAAVLGDAGAE